MANYSEYESAAEQPRMGGRSARKARARAMLALVVAATAGLLATWMIARAIARREPRMVAFPTKKVVVAKLDLPLAAALTADMLEVVDWPESSVPAGAFGDAAALTGRVVRGAVVRGEPILEARLAPKDGGSGLSAVIPAKLRAMTVKVTESSGVAGFIHPGDLVDVIATMAPRRDDPEPRSRVILQNIRVIAVGEELEAQSARPIKVPVVTLLVAPADSERLALAALHGDLQLTMRSSVDDEEIATNGVSAPDIYGDGVRKASPAPRPGGGPAPGGARPMVAEGPSRDPGDEVVEIIRGSRSEERKLKPTGGQP